MFGTGQVQGDQESSNEFDNSVVSEFVIHTAVIAQESGVDRLVVVSTKRIVVADYKRSRAGPLHVKCWEANINDIMSCEFEKLGGKPKVTFVATKGNKETRIRRRRSSVATDFQDGLLETIENSKLSKNAANSFTVNGDYRFEDALTVLNNCVNTMLHCPHRIHDLDKDTPEFFEDIFDVVHIGPWKFDIQEGQLPGETKDLRMRQQQLIEDLRMEKWIVYDDSTTTNTSSSSSSGPLSTMRNREPTWLEKERKEAIVSHEYITEVARYLRLITTRPGNIAESRSGKSVASNSGIYWPDEGKYNELLSKGLLSYEEYVSVRQQCNISEILEFLKDTDASNSPSKPSVQESQRAINSTKPKRRSLNLKLRAVNWFKTTRTDDGADDDSEDAGRQSVSSMASVATTTMERSYSIHPVIKALSFASARNSGKNDQQQQQQMSSNKAHSPSQRVTALQSLTLGRFKRGSDVFSFFSGKSGGGGSDTSRYIFSIFILISSSYD